MKRRLHAWGLCVLFSLAVPAQSQAGVIEWIDNLSGPGDFFGVSFEWRLVCFVEAEKEAPEEKTRIAAIGVIGPGCVFKRVPSGYRRVASVNLQFGFYWDKAKENRLKYADPSYDEKVRMTTLEPSFWVRAKPWMEVGSAAGVAWFSGPGFDSFPRLYLKPLQIDLKPLAFGKRYGTDNEVLVLRLSAMVFPEGFDSADFGALPGFKTDRDLVANIGVILDLDPLFD
jgi:hypothetical protein